MWQGFESLSPGFYVRLRGIPEVRGGGFGGWGVGHGGVTEGGRGEGIRERLCLWYLLQ